MVLPKRWNEIGRGHLLLRGPEMKPIAQRCVLCHGDNGCFPIFALGSRFSLFAGFSFFPLWSLFSGVAFFTLGSLLSLLARFSFFPLWSLFAGITFGSLGSLLSLFVPFSSGSYLSMNGGIGSAGGLSASPAIAAAILHNTLPLIG